MIKKIASSAFAIILSTSSFLMAVVPSVDEQIAKYTSIFTELNTPDFEGKENSQHIPKLAEMAMIGYEYVEQCLNESHAPAADKVVLAQFKTETCDVIHAQHLTLVAFKKHMERLAFLMSNSQPKGRILQGLEKQFKVYELQTWKNLSSELYNHAEMITELPFPYGFEAIIFAKAEAVAKKKFIEAFINTPFISLVVLSSDHRAIHGNFAGDPASAFFFQSAGIRELFEVSDDEGSFEKKSREIEIIRSIVRKIWSHNAQPTIAQEVFLYLLTRSPSVSFEDIMDMMDDDSRNNLTHRKIFEFFTKAVIDDLNQAGKVEEDALSDAACFDIKDLNYPGLGQQKYEISVHEIEDLGNGQYKAKTHMTIQLKPDHFRVLASFDLRFSLSDAATDAHKTMTLHAVTDFKPNQQLSDIVEYQKHPELLRSVSYPGEDELMLKVYALKNMKGYIDLLKSECEKLVGHTENVTNPQSIFTSFFAHSSALVNSTSPRIRVPEITETNHRAVIDAMAANFMQFYEDHKMLVSDRLIGE